MNFFKSTLRNFWKNRGYSFLNIFGLAMGIACAGLIFLWVEDELNYDSVYTKKDQLYSVISKANFDGKIFTFGVQSNATPAPLAGAIKTEIPGIVNSCRLSQNTNTLFNLGDKSIYESGYYTDPSVFSMFTLSFVEGNASTAFSQLNSVVISEKMAKHFFGTEKNIAGKTIRANHAQNYVVTGVIKDLPENSTLQFDWVSPFEVLFKQNPWLSDWGAFSINTYVELSPATDLAAVNKQLDGMIIKNKPGINTHLSLLSMNDWRLRSDFVDGKQSGGRMQYVRLFTAIAWIILLIACINFMNLATARSEKRAREVGVRKVLGAGKSNLILQFIGEAVFMAVLASFAGLIMISLMMPAFNMLVEKHLAPDLGNPLHTGSLLAITLLCGLIAGSYPALYLSSFNPIFVFKGLKLKSGSAVFIRKGLVVLQFTVSIVLIISTIIIYQQINHIKSRDLGYRRDNLLTLPINGDMLKNYSAIRQDLLNTGLIENVALNSMNIISTGDNGSSKNLQWAGKNPNAEVLISFRSVSPDFIATAGIKMAEGRGFVSEISDSTNVLVTESFAKMMGKGSALGKTITGQGIAFHVIGVVKDFVYGDLYGSPDPVMFSCRPQDASQIYVRIKDQAGKGQALAKIEAVIKKNNPSYPFQYSFVDDQFNFEFRDEALIGKLSRLFAGLAILISCLGLFGLAAYTAERRTKEIGIRKVLGASVAGITRLLSKDFLRLIVLSALIAFPLAWWVMSRWLQNYTYRITISWWVFLLAGGLSVVIALATISFQSVRAALMNPVKSLRSE
ncbi:MAG TPA: ABC transporter permease [Puia sp.]|nr:ABC transporter permease [Puia sp.]